MKDWNMTCTPLFYLGDSKSTCAAGTRESTMDGGAFPGGEDMKSCSCCLGQTTELVSFILDSCPVHWFQTMGVLQSRISQLAGSLKPNLKTVQQEERDIPIGQS